MTRDSFFRAEALLSDMASVLPIPQDGDTTSLLSSSLDAIALFVHCCMRTAGFRLLGFNEDRDSKIESQLRASSPRLIPQWNDGLNTHSFLYAHSQSSMNFILRVDRLGSKVEIRGLAVGDERIARVEITARDYISSSALPVRSTSSSSSTTTSSSNTTEGGGGGGGEAAGGDERTNDAQNKDLQEKLGRVFMSPERIEDLASLLKIKIIQKLLPGYTKEGWTEEEDPDDRAARQDADAAGRSGSGGARQPQPQPQPVPAQDPTIPRPGQPNPYFPLVDPLAAPPRRPVVPAGDFPPPDFEDEYEVNRPPRNPIVPGGGVAGDYGRSDLYPAGLGPDDPIRGSFVPGGPLRPGGLGPLAGGGGGGRTGGMHPTFDDPLFRGPGGRGRGGPDGDEGFDLQVPPGARWDPVGPGGFPRFGSGRGGQGGPFGPGGNSGFGGGGFGGDII